MIERAGRSGFRRHEPYGSCRRMPDKKMCAIASHSDQKSSEDTIEILVEGQECPFCHFAKLKRDKSEITCPICGYGFILNGRKPCT